MIEINETLVKKLITAQFPEWSHLFISPVKKSGHDNRTFHLGNNMSVRLPSGKEYAPQIEKENRWLPYLQSGLSFPISHPLAQGQPSSLFPYPWSVNRWIRGGTADTVQIESMDQFARDLALFLKMLQSIDATQGPRAGEHNFFRGASICVYDREIQEAFKILQDVLPIKKLHPIWNKAMLSQWNRPNVWVHGDIAPGNLLVTRGRLSGIIDFGTLGTGDPACDYAIAWTFFDKQSRETFYSHSGCDAETWNRAKAWALWKAMITYTSENEVASFNAKYTIQSILNDESTIQTIGLAIDEDKNCCSEMNQPSHISSLGLA